MAWMNRGIVNYAYDRQHEGEHEAGRDAARYQLHLRHATKHVMGQVGVRLDVREFFGVGDDANRLNLPLFHIYGQHGEWLAINMDD